MRGRRHWSRSMLSSTSPESPRWSCRGGRPDGHDAEMLLRPFGRRPCEAGVRSCSLSDLLAGDPRSLIQRARLAQAHRTPNACRFRPLCPHSPRTIARPPPLPVLSTPVSPAAAVAGKAIDAGDPARESTSRFSVSTILIALNLALIVALGGYAVLGDWSASTAGKGPAPKPQPVPDQGRALQPGHAAAGGRVLPISLPQPAPRPPAPGLLLLLLSQDR